MATGDAQLFEEVFALTMYNQSKYDRVARIGGRSLDNMTDMELDVNIELFPCTSGENIQIVLAATLALDGSRENEERGWRDTRGESTLADMFDYVCYGKIYKFEDGSEGSLRAYISFGGLLMKIEGPYAKMTPLRVENTYLLVKRA
ncbi:putative RNA polymerase Rpb8 [Rosellinia necatrix]|uniref:DNA-directed RNA polymerases I, II, and III subunit RPABC3 n=1 Tax=Rosellinia necatrix TaxID=77044 RepID=A0A1W2TTT7_ROSNE|nr:putative RNA polymerase Rpb8 [Rosellinia necatrix]